MARGQTFCYFFVLQKNSKCTYVFMIKVSIDIFDNSWAILNLSISNTPNGLLWFIRMIIELLLTRGWILHILNMYLNTQHFLVPIPGKVHIFMMSYNRGNCFVTFFQSNSITYAHNLTFSLVWWYDSTDIQICSTV